MIRQEHSAPRSVRGSTQPEGSGSFEGHSHATLGARPWGGRHPGHGSTQFGWRWCHRGKGAGMFSGRRKFPATKAVAAGAIGLGAGIFGFGPVALAAEPTQQEMLEQIKALQAKVEQM